LLPQANNAQFEKWKLILAVLKTISDFLIHRMNFIHLSTMFPDRKKKK